MADPNEILGGMTDVVDEQVENLDSSISQVQEQIDAYTEEIDGVENGMAGVAESEMTTYLNDTKLAEIQDDYGDPLTIPFSVDYGGNYGTIDYTTGGITDFTIIDNAQIIMYEYGGVNWDSDVTITKLVSDYAFANDYLTRPLTSGATYGLYPNVETLTSAKNILQANKSKIAASKTTFEDYV